MDIQIGDRIEQNMCTYLVLDVTENTVTALDSYGNRKSLYNTPDINIVLQANKK